MSYDGSLKFDTKLDESGFNAGVSKLGSIAKSGMAVLGAAVVSGVAAFGALSKAALDSVASLEQNIGGVETLFKDSADTVVANAKRAYETAGMSANEYMSTVTSFSASLLQSVGNDTAKAADYADQAIIDMSDNANKMGTSMELIQNAYQGFAKQNYTMLDNLKLGYGGTKTEMERLIADANKVKEANGEMADLSIDSFADVTEAIHIIQSEMGITGTTAAEAATTIEGSMNAAKAAWDNFLNGTASAEEFATAVGVAANVIIKNLGEIIPRLAEAIPEAAGAIYEQLANTLEENGAAALEIGTGLIANLAMGITQALPDMVNVAVEIINSLAGSLNENLPMLLSAGGQLLASLVNGVVTLLPTILSLGMNIVTTLWNGLQLSGPLIITQAISMVSQWVATALSYLPTVLDTGFQIIENLLLGLLQNAPNVIVQVGTMLTEWVATIINMLPSILQSGVKMILSLLDGLVANAPQIISQAAIMLADFIATIGANLPQILQKGIEIIGQLLAGIISKAPDLIAAIPDIIADVASAFLDKDWGSIGWDIIQGIAAGIKNAAGDLVEAAAAAADDALNWVKDKLGIHSPSRVFRDQVGKMMALGMGVGFEQNVPLDSMGRAIETSVNTMAGRVGTVTKHQTATTASALRSVTNNYTNAEGIDYNKLEKAQTNALNKANKKPIYLDNRRVDRATRNWKGGVVPT